MNCREVESMVIDLARGVFVDEAALGHLKTCERCGERLATEKRLSEGLAAWAQASSGEGAPVEVEARLLAAFRQRRGARRRWIGVAAVGAIAAGVMVFEFVRVPPLAPPTMVVARQAPGPSIDIKEPPPAKPVVVKNQANRLPHLTHLPKPQPVDVGTDFLPVDQDDGWTPLEGGRLVRVELPKSALGVFGLPVDEERGPERVRADVMVSHDGLLRAIRFVH